MRYLYALTLIVGTTYLVGWCDWSKWTFVFMLLLLGGIKIECEGE